MPRITKKTDERIERFQDSWEEMAPGASFAGMTLEEFRIATELPLALRREIVRLETQVVAKTVETEIADKQADQLLDLVVNSVRGTPGFGPDCALYKAFGYVRKSERKSGLTRKGTTTGDSATGGTPPAGDADAA